jgi:hypothetical protein
MLRFVDVIVQVVYIVEPRRMFVVLNDRQLAALGEPTKLARTHAKIPGGLFRPQ